MDIRIEANDQESECKVWLNDTAVTFRNLKDAQAYIDQLKKRIDAAHVGLTTTLETQSERTSSSDQAN